MGCFVTGWFVALLTTVYLCAHSHCCVVEGYPDPPIEDDMVQVVEATDPMLPAQPSVDSVDELNAMDGLYQ